MRLADGHLLQCVRCCSSFQCISASPADVTIIDVNDNQPTFVAAQYELTISTRTSPDTTVAVLDARDNDDLVR